MTQSTKPHMLITRILLLIYLPLFFSTLASAQKPETQLNGFGHLEFTLNQQDETNSYFTIGEHDFFVTSKLRKNISFLGEYVFRFGSGSYLPSIERSLIKFNYKGNHSIIAGKLHTPVNYWNDTYHHGRLFFPTIDRPLAFTYFIPLHTLGVQLQGQNLGKLNFGYDVVVGNGIQSTDVKQNDPQFSVTAAVHIKPVDNLRIGLAYNKDYLSTNTPGVHSGHLPIYQHYSGPIYSGAVDFQLGTFSLAYFADKFEFLSESSMNVTRTDSLGQANNFSSFLYSGYRLKDHHVPFLFADYVYVAENDLYTHQLEIIKFGLGYKYEFNHLINVKTIFEYEHLLDGHNEHGKHNRLGVRLQLAYGF